MTNFYPGVVSCNNSIDTCPGIIKEAKKGCPSRGLYAQGNPRDISIVVVGKNQGKKNIFGKESHGNSEEAV